MNPAKESCRLCLAPSPEQSGSICDSAMRSKLDVVFKFELPVEDVLPAVVCSECSAKIDEFYSFHETVRINQTQLKMSDAHMLLLVEVKGEPADTGEENDPVDFAAVERNPEDGDDSHASVKSDLDELEDAAKVKVLNEKVKSSMEDNLKIEQFFNGIPCSICSVVSQTFDQLKAHGKHFHGINASVMCCKRKFLKKSVLVEHLNAKHLNPKQFHCELCKKNFGCKYNLDIHNLKLHANPEEHPYQCNKCGRKFPKEHFLITHLKAHVQEMCTICGRTMANAYSLKLHMQSKHGEGERKSTSVHICDTCGQTYHDKQRLEKHINLQHRGIKDADRIQCRECDKWFSADYIRHHTKIAHSGKDQQPVTCPICQQVYSNRRSLNSHKIYMHQERKLECGICGKAFRHPRSLREHRAAHMGQRLYSCVVCDYSSNSNGNLYGHMKNKHPAEWAQLKANGAPLLARHNEPMEAAEGIESDD